jgi:replicative DNA helicase
MIDNQFEKLLDIEESRISSPGSERIVLASIFKNFDSITDSIDLLQPIDFSSRYNSNIYAIAYDCFVNKKTAKLDKFLVIEAANEKGLKIAPENDKKFEYLDAIIDMRVDSKNIREAVIRVKKKAIQREIFRKAREVQGELLLDKEETIEQIVGKVQNIFFGEIKSLIGDSGVSKLTEGAIDLLNERANNPVPLMGISTGFPRYDALVGHGLRRGSLNVIVGRAKSGKSCFLLQIATYIALRLGIKVLYLDTEQNKEEQQFRMIAQYTGIPIYELESGKWRASKKYVDTITNIRGKFNEAQLYYEKITAKTPAEICNIIRRWALKELRYDSTGKIENALVILDYIKIMSKISMKDINEWQMLGLIVTDYKDLAESLDISILTAAQANRAAIGKKAIQQDASLIAASDRISWFASSCTIISPKIYEEVLEDGIQNGNTKLVTVISRFSEGSQLNDWINYDFQRQGSLRFTELNSNAERLCELQSAIMEKKEEEIIENQGEIK